ncbi:MAG: ABC transporter ATP-binding protein [Candidatus Hodarchaeales archaeon]
MIELKNVWAKYGRLKALKGINLRIKPKEYVVLLGPSGAGKSTLLRTVAGLVKQSEGDILLGIGTSEEEDQSSNGGNVMINVNKLPPESRNVAFLPQTYALFPHLNVWENTVFGPTVKFWPEERLRVIGWEILQMVKLEGRTDAFPNELSGGMQQRCALARALAASSKILLLDEPLRALDARLRIELREELRRLSDQLGMTTIHVTHDQEEAINIADRIVIMNKGEIEQIGTPEEIYNKPVSPFVASFVGEANFFPGKVISSDNDEITIAVTGDEGKITVKSSTFFPGDNVVVAVKPEKIKIIEEIDKQAHNYFTGTTVNSYFLGRFTSIKVKVKGLKRIIKIKQNACNNNGVKNGVKVQFTFSKDACTVFKHDGGAIDDNFAEE